MTDFIIADDRQNEVRMFDLPSNRDIYAFPEFKSDVFTICLTGDNVPACVASFTGYSSLRNQDPAFREELAELVQQINAGTKNPLVYVALLSHIYAASTGTRQASNVLQGVDVSFKESEFPNPVVPGLPGPGSDKVSFNTCLDNNGMPNPNDNGGKFYAYATAMHEAGHALGLSNFDYTNFLTTLGGQSYEVAHPTIPDAVMNYDSETEGPARTPGKHEPDCSPHPFDLLAIYALYQKVR